MIRITEPAWQVMVEHAERQYPNECCGAMQGVARPETVDGEPSTVKEIVRAVPLENAYEGPL